MVASNACAIDIPLHKAMRATGIPFATEFPLQSPRPPTAKHEPGARTRRSHHKKSSRFRIQRAYCGGFSPDKNGKDKFC
jgi:hypothetical protein